MTGFRNRTHTAILIGMLAIGAVVFWGCGDDNGNGNGPVEPGAIAGVVQLPFKLAAAGEPVEGAIVQLTAGDLDTATTTDANGEFLFTDVPAGNAQVDVTFGSCLAVTRDDATVTENDTTDLILELESHADIDSVTVGWANATRMELSPNGDRLVMIFNAAARNGTPGIATVDLGTKSATTRDLSEFDDVFDLQFVTSQLAVFNYRSGNSYGVQFVDPTTVAQSGSDVMYQNFDGIQHDGRLVALPSGTDVFVTHGIRKPENTRRAFGIVYRISVPQRNLVDPDDDVFNGEFAFDNDLVGGALGWPYNIGYDAVRGEVLVGNRDSTTVTAIDLSHWGDFDRSVNLSMPTDGVRHITMAPPQVYIDQGYSVLEWGFDGGQGVATRLVGGKRAPILRYTSGGNASDLFYLDTVSFPASSNHLLKIIPERNSWLSMFRDPERSFSGNEFAIEERSLSDLRRVYRYESRFLDTFDPRPTAYDADPIAGYLYVAYKERDWVEVYCLPEE
ncbi:MAG: hypothetical protein GF341_04670 [candidate division Zixibacteria bacterium]|nr:hypothetical protein [candidate division Zixibacteria bacterium]